MNVLLVDDQIRVLSGLISGLDWDTLGVTSIRTASSAAQAKSVFLETQVDILLCDIEMPGENGLSLLRWARSKGMDFICVFLTSHADFLYAKEAIQLGCFDYILQPAPYEEIQATVARAIARVKDTSADKELRDYGVMAKKQEAALFQNLFSDWSAGRSLSISALRGVLHHLGQEVPEDCQCFVIWGHLLRWHDEPWPTQEWVYAVNNMIAELYEKAHCGILPFSIDRTSLGWFIYAPMGNFSQDQDALTPLNKAYLAISQHLPCEFAFYVSPIVPLTEINDQSSLLLDAKQNNVVRESGIFCPKNRQDKFHMEKLLDTVQLRRWEELLANGLGATTQDEALRYLDSLVEERELDQRALRNFWIQFQQVAFNATKSLKMKPPQMLAAAELGNQATSLQEVQGAVKAIVSCFPKTEQYSGNEKKLVEQVRKYVEDNLDQSLNVNGVAAAMFMNSDYISRVFKNETNIPLKEYIIQRKMESAKLLLTTTQLPVSVIASKLGYDNFSYFSQVYRRCMGVTPSEERKRRESV
ncbi:MAG: response regulator transcription factor [Acutalibacter sp.]|jgi:two-component system response regulator YesN